MKIVVIGAGLMGSAAAWTLAKLGYKVTLVEQQSSDYLLGSSRGKSRICRNFSQQGIVFGLVHQFSIEAIKELIAYLNEIGQTACIEDIYTTTPVTYLATTCNKEEVEKFTGIEFQWSENKEEAARKFGIDIEEGFSILREQNKYSGTLNPHRLIQYLQIAIKAKGAEIYNNTKVTDFRKEATGFQLKLENLKNQQLSDLQADKCIVTCGPYTSSILKQIYPKISKVLKPQRLVLCFFKLRREKFKSLSAAQKIQINRSFPMVDYRSFYYAMQEPSEDEIPYIKCGLHLNHQATGPLDKVWDIEASESDKNQAQQATLKYLNCLGLQLSEADLLFDHAYSCVYTMTRDESPYVLQLPKLENLVVACGFSGIGAKGSMAYGAFAVQKLLGIGLIDASKTIEMESNFGQQKFIKELENG